jgi:hypothetical protein
MHSPFTDIPETTSKQWFHCQGGHATIHGINIPNGILGTLKKKRKKKKSFCGCVCQAESHLLFIRTHPQYSEEKVPHPKKLGIMSKLQTLPSNDLLSPPTWRLYLDQLTLD